MARLKGYEVINVYVSGYEDCCLYFRGYGTLTFAIVHNTILLSVIIMIEMLKFYPEICGSEIYCRKKFRFYTL